MLLLIFRDQLLRNRPDRALRTMKSFPKFAPAFHDFVHEEARKESECIKSDRDPPRTSFTLDTLRKFSYKEQLTKLQRSSPLLVACVAGSISKEKTSTLEDISRKGFGGKNRDQNIDLVPALVQSVVRILKNRHPFSLSTMACLNSLFLWTNRVSGHVFQLFNSLGDCYRYETNILVCNNHALLGPLLFYNNIKFSSKISQNEIPI